jgi:hypothetical protein
MATKSRSDKRPSVTLTGKSNEKHTANPNDNCSEVNVGGSQASNTSSYSSEFLPESFESGKISSIDSLSTGSGRFPTERNIPRHLGRVKENEKYQPGTAIKCERETVN